MKSVHPGEQLREEFLPEYGITASQLADSIGVSDETMSRILDEKSGLTPNIAIRLGKFFGTSAEMWMNTPRMNFESVQGNTLSAFLPKKLDVMRDGSYYLLHTDDNVAPR